MNARDLYRDVMPDTIKNHLRPLKRRAELGYVWLQAKRGYERLRPAFLIIGAEKAGTTSLFRYLAYHPKIVEPLRKEILYFQAAWDRPFAWYLAHFPRADRVPPGVMTGEASPSYLFDPLVPERVARFLPEVKIIALLRNPIARAISHYYHKVNKKVGESCGLVECLLAEGMQLRPDLTDRLVSEYGLTRERLYAVANTVRLPTYIQRGFYADQLLNWYKHFDRDQILVLNSEDMFENPRDVYARTLRFLDLDFFDIGPMRAYNAGRYGDVDPIIIRYLSEIYADSNRSLYQLLGVDFGWND